MNKQAGVWIDHRKAVIVFVLDHTEKIKRILSNLEKHVRYSGASESSGSQDDSAEDQRDRRFNNQLQKYYEEVVVALDDADSILILGPGEAKTELEAYLKDQKSGKRLLEIEATDKMTDGQIAAKVRKHFGG